MSNAFQSSTAQTGHGESVTNVNSVTCDYVSTRPFPPMAYKTMTSLSIKKMTSHVAFDRLRLNYARVTHQLMT